VKWLLCDVIHWNCSKMTVANNSGSIAGKGAGLSVDRTQGSIVRNLLVMAWPIASSFGLYSVFSVVDMIWIGRLGSEYIAGVGAAAMALWLGLSGAMGIAVGARALVARFAGSGDLEAANRVTAQALLAAGVYGLCVAVLAASFAAPILRLVGVDESVVAKGALYMRIYALSAIPSSLWIVLESVMQASGDVIRPLLMTVAAKVVHAAVEPLFIFGWFFFPALGVQGAAFTFVLTESIGLAAGVWIVLHGYTRLRFRFSRFKIELRTVWRIVRIGLPAVLFSAQASLASLVLLRIMAPFGTMAVAAHNLSLRVEGLVLMPIGGMSLAAAVLVGQNLGAQRPDRAEKGAWIAIALIEGFTALVAVAILIFAECIVRIFNPEPELIGVASGFLRIAATGYLVVGISSVLQNCLNGAGDTVPPTLITLLITWLVQVPMAFFLPSFTTLGPYSVRWSILTGWVVAAVAYVLYFRLGRWKRKRV
jgi:putative MATE family efflux protein